MPVPSLPVGITDVVTEFGGPDNLVAYLRGGLYVQDTTTNSGVASSLPLTLSSFVGATKPEYNLDGEAILSTGGGTVYAGIRVNNSGTIEKRGPLSSSFTLIDTPTDWVIPNEENGEFIRLDVTSGAAPEGTSDSTGVWLALSTTRLWYVTDSGGGVSDGHWRVRISRNSSGTDIVADSNPGEYRCRAENDQ